MSTENVMWIVLFVLIVGMTVRKMIMKKKVPHYDATAVAAMLKEKGKVVLLDVRTSQERSRQRIDGSIHIPLQELRGRMNELEKHRSKEIICYCASGNRSLSAASMIGKRGYRAANLSGGISSWFFN